MRLSMVCICIDGDKVVLGVHLKEQKSGNKSERPGSEGPRFESKEVGPLHCQEVSHNSLSQFPSRSIRARLSCARPSEASVNLIDFPHDRNS